MDTTQIKIFEKLIKGELMNIRLGIFVLGIVLTYFLCGIEVTLLLAIFWVVILTKN